MRYITHQGVKYRIRGNHTPAKLHELYDKFIAELNRRADAAGTGHTKLTFKGWLVGFGKVHSRVKP